VHTPEQQIIQGIREGKQEYFQEVFNAYYESLCHYAYTILRDMDEAEDIVQSMLLKLWEKRENLHITYAIRSYLYKAVHNLCINQLEHRQIKQKHLEHTTRESAGEKQLPEVFPQELGDSIASAIDRLPEQCRIIFKMSRYDEMRYAEIARTLGISVNTVENQVSKALRILRTQLNDIFV
jgi:RNA polymerase sigma-70 factor, ECF subfamily